MQHCGLCAKVAIRGEPTKTKTTSLLYPKDEWDPLEFSIARTPENAFTEEGIDYDDFGGHDMTNLILSGAAHPSSDKDQRIVSLYRLLAETKATLDAQGKGKRILTTTRDIFAAASLDTMQKTNEQHNDGCLAETDLWLDGEREQVLIRAQFPGCTCTFCARSCARSVPL
jgi:hypothetical protein